MFVAEIVEGCVGSRLNLTCKEMKVIQIVAVVLGDSYCSPVSCCIKYSRCTYFANESHTADVHRRCDNKNSCTVTVVQERIPCASWGWWVADNHFERITYVCVDYPRCKLDIFY